MSISNVTIVRPDSLPILNKLKVAAYARVSVESEMSEHSLGNQIEVYRTYIKGKAEWDFAGVYADEGFTGTKACRPGFQALLKDCEEGKIDIVLVKSISRFARNTVDLLNTIRHLKELGVKIRFERENIDSDSASGELLITLLASFAQEEARSVSENTKWAIRKRFEQGKDNSFFLYGYKWNGTEFIIVPEQAEVVRQIYSDYLAGMSPDQITKKLVAQGVPSTRGKQFHYTLVWDILRLEKYRGDSLLQKTYSENYITKRSMTNHGELPMYYAEGTHPQIVDDETYDAVQKEIERRKELGYLANQSLTFSCFTGKVRCAYCGRTFRKRMQGMKNRINKGYRWVCGNKIEHTSSFCNAQNVPDKVLYSITSDLLGLEDFSDEQFNAIIDHIEVSRTNTLKFIMKDGTSVIRTWLCTTNNRKMREEINGRISNTDSCDKEQVLITDN